MTRSFRELLPHKLTHLIQRSKILHWLAEIVGVAACPFHGVGSVRWPTWCLCCYVANAVANMEFLLFCGQRPMVSALGWRKSWNHLLPVLYVVFVVPGGNCGVRAVLWPTWLCGQWCSWCSVTNMAKQWVILMNC